MLDEEQIKQEIAHWNEQLEMWKDTSNFLAAWICKNHIDELQEKLNKLEEDE